jgi:hypothetical protein
MAAMPRLAPYAYTKLNALSDLLRDAPNIGRPRKITTDWLKSRGVSTNGDTIIRVLRFVGLIRHDGTPTDLWDTISNPNPSNKIRFADAVRTAYDDLFADYPHAEREDDKTLSTYFQSYVQAQPPVQRAVLRTFRTLVKFGDFDTDSESLANNLADLPELVRSVEALENKARDWLDAHNEIQAKLKALDPIHKLLDQLSIAQDELLRDSLIAAEAGLFRASHVLAWGGFTDFLYKPFTIDALKTARPEWKIKTSDDIYRRADYQLIELGKELSFYDNTTMKTLHGMLNDRNRCAHGLKYSPDLNETLGYLSKLLHMIEDLQGAASRRWA